MRFYLRKRRQPPAVIIVALIDVLIVVLIFLMVTTSFKKPQFAVKVTLPESTQAIKSGANENPPLVIVVEEDGNVRYGPESKPVTMDRLKQELLAEAAKNPQLRLTLNIDKKGPWGQVVKVMDVAKEANIKSVNAAVKETAQP